MKHLLILLPFAFLFACQPYTIEPNYGKSDLVFSTPATTWDEGIPLGNAVVGALVWQKEEALRLSLDRVDLWDLRPMGHFSGPQFSYKWICEHVQNKDYQPIHDMFDTPYDSSPGPTKIPGAALEFPLEQLGKPTKVALSLQDAVCQVFWGDATQMTTFVHANRPVGWFVFDNVPDNFEPTLVAPKYETTGKNNEFNSLVGADLPHLQYPQGQITRKGNTLIYNQKGWEDFSYQVAVTWQRKGQRLYGLWCVTSSLCPEIAQEEVELSLQEGLKTAFLEHRNYWENFWSKSSVSLPDTLLQKQYDNEMYKFGSAARQNSYPISLQAVWTADNGQIPPWKGDYHHDLNTQLSYWPAYIGNHLEEEMGYLNTLWSQRDVYKKYTREFFGTDGLNVPGVATLTGEPMGGWVQYSMSPTCSSWLSQHFYLHWKYSADEVFLKEKGYPFVKDVAVFLEQITYQDNNGYRRLPLSTSPEVFDNSPKAWFTEMTNYDVALIHFVFRAAAEMADALTLTDQAAHWRELDAQVQPLDTDAQDCLTFAKGTPYDQSHRHFSHAMSIHPLGLIDWSMGDDARRTIKATLQRMDSIGPGWWVGYSYSWLANMKARARDGEGAAQALRTFAECFCLKNTFHANGDQTKSGKSNFTYRPFTLEGNFAFASGVQEMLLQSHTGTIQLFPAIPDSWKNVAFTDLRAMGGYLVSARLENGEIKDLRVLSEHGGPVTLFYKGEEITCESVPLSR